MSFPHLQQAFHRKSRQKAKYFHHNKIVYGKTAVKFVYFHSSLCNGQCRQFKLRSCHYCGHIYFSLQKKLRLDCSKLSFFGFRFVVLFKFEKLVRRDFEGFADPEQCIERNGLVDIDCFNLPDERGADIHPFGELLLRQPFQFPVICDLQANLLIVVFEIFLHSKSLHRNIICSCIGNLYLI